MWSIVNAVFGTVDFSLLFQYFDIPITPCLCSLGIRVRLTAALHEFAFSSFFSIISATHNSIVYFLVAQSQNTHTAAQMHLVWKKLLRSLITSHLLDYTFRSQSRRQSIIVVPCSSFGSKRRSNNKISSNETGITFISFSRTTFQTQKISFSLSINK